MPADLSGPGEVRFHEQPDETHRAHGRRRGQPAPLDVDLGRAGRRSRCPCHAQEPPVVTAVEPVGPDDEAAVFVANIGSVLILVGIFSFGFTVLTGVVEEKQSRVVEVVLSTVVHGTC